MAETIIDASIAIDKDNKEQRMKDLLETFTKTWSKIWVIKTVLRVMNAENFFKELSKGQKDRLLCSLMALKSEMDLLRNELERLIEVGNRQ